MKLSKKHLTKWKLITAENNKQRFSRDFQTVDVNSGVQSKQNDISTKSTKKQNSYNCIYNRQFQQKLTQNSFLSQLRVCQKNEGWSKEVVRQTKLIAMASLW